MDEGSTVDMILIGKNLGERQKDLNSKVNDAFARNIDFDVIKTQFEQSDVDVFYKIDIAAKYQNADYILEILKSNDSLHITRAINKCEWLFDSEHSRIINVEFLDSNIFPHISIKMKRKLLKTVSRHVKDETQAEIFYNYCLKENLTQTAHKFLLYTSEDFRLRFITNYPDSALTEIHLIFHKENLKQFLGNSFTLAKAFLEKTDKYKRDQLLTKISYFYFISNEEYLDLVEKYYNIDFFKLSNNVTKDIAVKHKNRILAQLPIYLRKLDTKTLVRCSTLDEVKKYAIEKLSNTAERFWRSKYWKSYKIILSAIPAKERFAFVKDIFEKKYPGKKFETSEEFYTYGFYNLMTREQRLKATENVESDESSVSIVRIKRNLWYKAVPFDLAFATFQEKMLSNNNDKVKRNLLMVLIKACKLQENLKKVLNYYIEHNENWNGADKEKIINAVFQHHKIFDLEIECWVLLQKMLLDKNVCGNSGGFFESVVCLYHILHEKDFPDEAKSLLDTRYPYSFIMGLQLIKNENQKNIAYEYMYQYRVDKLHNLKDKNFDDSVKKQAREHINFILTLLNMFDKSKNDICEIVRKYMDILDKEELLHFDFVEEQNYLFRQLKKDASTVTDFQAIKENLLTVPNFRLVQLLRKLKIYFSHDIARDFFKFFEECISGTKDYDLSVINTSVVGLFLLGDEEYKEVLMLKNGPISSRIDRASMDRFHFDLQDALCRYSYFSRPPFPYDCLIMFSKEVEHTRSCMPTIKSLLVNVPTQYCRQLATMLLNTPNTMRQCFYLVYTHFNIKTFKEIVDEVWRTAVNSKVRRNLFTLLYSTIQREDDETQTSLFECLKVMIMDLRENDHAGCFKFLDNDEIIPESIIYELLEASWESVGKFRGRNEIKSTLVHYIDYHMSKINKEFVRKIVEENIKSTIDFETNSLEKAKWELTVSYLLHSSNHEDTNKVFDLVDVITIKLLEENWSSAHKLSRFVSKLLEKCVEEKRECYSQANSIIVRFFSRIVSKKSFKTHYLILWDLKLAVISNKVMDVGTAKLQDSNLDQGTKAKEIEFYFAKEIGALIEDLIEKNIYQTFYVSQLANKICKLISNTGMFLDITHVCKLHWFYLVLFFVEGLMNFEKTETHLLALHILCKEFPEDLGECKDYYKSLFDRIKTFQNGEVQCFLNQQFSNNGVKRRRVK